MIPYKEIKEKSSMSRIGYLFYLAGVWRLGREGNDALFISTRFWNPLSWLFCVYVFVYCFVRSFIVEGLWDLFYYIKTIVVPNFLNDINISIGKATLKKRDAIWVTKFNKSSAIICNGDTKVRGEMID